MSASDSWDVTIFGRGAHGSMPERSLDPIVMAASAVLNLQTVVSRQIGMEEEAVVTVGSFHAGVSENTIPEEALLRLNVRSFNDEVRTRVLDGIRRIFKAEAVGAGAPKEPAIAILGEHPLTRNDEAATHRIVEAFAARFGAANVQEIPPATASEDFGLFGAAWGIPSVMWFVGGTDPAVLAAAAQPGGKPVPANHAPDFAPIIHPTLQAGVEAMLTAAGLWLAIGDGAAN
ncbi:peptidase dimerization domain-containing protein [Starkeya koreensis]|uniref:Peptidase dimerization domain-containing protein n=1 Tax=Ancylobacter koreensis TaxID=266121 RepID=A0ABT0DQB8_9HYPH|nr:peptidase dimerization domain-containing protein [Ancylobacter koreensis]MCK0209471.1 peptidase dimerization domain-containing protein [Ancylobacter koreensis]